MMIRPVRRSWGALFGVALFLAWGTAVRGGDPKPEGGGDKTKAKPDKKADEGKTQARRPWGKRPSETDEQYRKRREGMISRCKKDKLGLFSSKTMLFLVRTDISPEFDVDLALYIEELHRAYGAAFSKLGAPASEGKDITEVVCYKDRETYIKEGGDASSGGHFHPLANRIAEYWNRPPDWPAGQFRLCLFTDGETDFDKWDKSAMKHEAAHMELQLRLGHLVLDAPRWWNEGMAACFEYWDFDKNVEQNFAAIPKRGRYAPFIRRTWGTKLWKDFNYVWTIDGASWHRDMSTSQGYLNYCQAWSLAAFMFNQGAKGKKFFNQIFNLTIRIGADRPDGFGNRTRGWEEAFRDDDRAKLEKAWNEWVQSALPKDGRNKGEEEFMLRRGYDPDAESLEPISPEARAKRLEKFKKSKSKPNAAKQTGDDD